MAKRNAEAVSIGLRAKTARAIAVVLAGPVDSPRVVRRVEVVLSDPAMPATSQPYHEVMDLSWERATVAVRKSAKKIESIASKALARLIGDAQGEGYVVRAVGIVGAGNRNLGKIGSTHIRAHAAEGVLFREVLEVAAAANKVRSRTFDQRSLDETAALELQLPIAKLKRCLGEMGHGAGSPWRADEKAAATAAWLSLASHGRK
jgi:hypothetical protein